MGSLDGRVAFITGVARGQGRSHALKLAEAGADIVGLDICEDAASPHYSLATESDLDETARLIEKLGRCAILRKADVRDLDQLRAVVDEGVANLGRLDIVVANAGICSIGGTHDLDEATFQEMIDINLTGVWRTVKATVPHLQAGGRGGSVILAGSGAAFIPPPHLAHYSAAKAGVNSLMASFALEFGPEFIRVNAVIPTNVDTPMLDNEKVRKLFMPHVDAPTRADAMSSDSEYVRMHLMPIPWVEPSDISEAVLFLASDASRYITGVALPIDAGYRLKK
ncbi:mycofactocin-coupled SDR family oxidoreductase [Amycolatopsis pithecellobii]|uniref:Mycofactocin-coupled SDR family oxidoreductase n=1 Tax=Amycolatopsis pithecellobii TaxID=664692 RepID=A0A6N7ZCP3_9PSEU|nr:mycofactocin-coupled SDR family oxidoreductase [Amycolatopsis pithecellobii]MTD59387.1 mycofactocin-coupled SDR family oxidoreductase [Amycolatopsis pithecellobii]